MVLKKQITYTPNTLIKDTSRIVLVLILLGIGQIKGEETKWIAVGDLHNWYSEAGCEIEVGRTGQVRDQQDGLRWPAFYPVQDNQAAKALWIGATNFYDPIADKTFDSKVVHVGPRFIDTQNETYRSSSLCMDGMSIPTFMWMGIQLRTYSIWTMWT